MTESQHTDRVRDLLEQRVLDAPAPPPLTEVVETCQRDLRRHRQALAFATVVAVAVVAVGTSTLVRSGIAGDAVDPAALGPDEATSSELVDACHSGLSTEAARRFQVSGQPVIRAQEIKAPSSRRVVLETADGRHWGDCQINYDEDAEFSSTMTIYASRPGQPNGYSAGFVCPDPAAIEAGPDCGDRFQIDYADRVAAEVASVEFTTADDKTITVEATRGGFILFVYTGTVPDGWTPDNTDYLDGRPWLTRITYLNDDGEPIAASNQGTLAQSDVPVGDLPPITAYPSRNDGPVWEGL